MPELNEEEQNKPLSRHALDCISEAEQHFHMINTSNHDDYMPYCENLLVCAIEEQSDELFSLAYFYMMMYYATGNDCINTVSCGLEGIKYQRTVQDFKKLARSYNTLGVFYETMGDTTNAVDSLLSCIDVSIRHNLCYEHFMALSNLADIFYCNSNYDRAIYYYTEAEAYYNKSGKVFASERLNILTGLLCSKGNCMLSINKLDEANMCGNKILEKLGELEAYGSDFPMFTVYIFLACLAHANDNADECEKYIALARKGLDECSNYVCSINDIVYFSELLIKRARYDDAIDLLNHFIAMCEKDSAPFHVYSMLMERLIDCAELMNDNENYLKYTRLFIDAFKAWRTRDSGTALRAERLHNENMRMQKLQVEMNMQNEKLLMQSQHDTLTGLPNRAYLNSYAEETLEKAIRDNTYFGIEILDIDYFKHLNDNYGHMEGDNYLKAVAQLLENFTHRYTDVFAARYGGDEFVMIYYGKTDDEIREIMASLKDYTKTITLPHLSALGCPYLSLSQGCFNHIPSKVNRLWDFLSVSDVALYEVKQKGRNGYLLRNEFYSR